MDGFLTSSFIKDFPGSIKKSLFNDSTSFYELFMAIKAGHLSAGTQGEAFVSVLEVLKKDEPKFYELFISLEASGKLTTKESGDFIPEFFKDIKIRKSELKRISEGYYQPADVIYHDSVSGTKWKKEIIERGSKPLIDNQDLQSGNVEYLFKELSIPLNQGDEFNWARFLSNYIYPFNKIRILDPFLFVNIGSTDIYNILRALIKLSRKNNLTVEIISNLSADSSRKSENVLKEVRDQLNLPERFKRSLKLYSQKGSASNIFHKRAIWTDFWVVQAERGLDFLKLETGKGTVRKENTLFLTGRYSSNDSLWHQINDNWENYLKHSKLVNIK